MRILRGFVGSVVKKPGTKEPEVVIRLTSEKTKKQNTVRYDFVSGMYQLVAEEDPVFDILTLPSRSVHRDDATFMDLNPPVIQSLEDTDVGKEAEALKVEDDVYSSVISKEELQRIDAQPNPFNFSDRVSQTIKISRKDLAIQTEPAPSTTFSINVSLYDIYQAYEIDYAKVVDAEKEMEKEKERERARDRSATKPTPVADPIRLAAGARHKGTVTDIQRLSKAVLVVERMIAQNSFDDILQDFRYWEDASDEYRCMEGSLLPLWKFHHDKSRALLVSAVCWSPMYHDLFAAAYATVDSRNEDGEGMLCFYTLKNPSTPERAVVTPSGATSLHLHPQYCSLLVAGFADGSVVVYDVRNPSLPFAISSSLDGKHLLPVTQVKWIRTHPREEVCLFSSALDGRVTQWHLHNNILIHINILDFKNYELLAKPLPPPEKITLEGLVTCIAFCPNNEHVILVGVDTGALYQCSITCSVHTLVRYSAHTSPVRGLAWNSHHSQIFLSCSVDWTVKVWLQHKMIPLIILDLGAAVAAAAWSPYSSSVFVAVTDDGRVHVYDLFVRKCKPLCVQTLVQRRRVVSVCVAFNPFHPIILVGGEKGYLASLKLSPNLRRTHRDAKGSDPQDLQEIEVCKMERLIATSNKE